MCPPAIQLESLAKSFVSRSGPVHAVRGVSLTVEQGQVYGFLGPNGAGKSTTIRMIVDLVRPTSGTVKILGEPVRLGRAQPRVGSLVEGAHFYPHLTGRQNLEVLARTSGCASAVASGRIDSLLDELGMAGRANRTVDGYSMGMKQRLGVAAALLNDPDVVLLDEPTNGLDPAGIREMRTFVRELVQNGPGGRQRTVFLSSHLLSEVEQVCDRVAILHRGRLAREGRVGELVSAAGRFRFAVTPVDRAAAVLTKRWRVDRLAPDPAGSSSQSPRNDSAAARRAADGSLDLTPEEDASRKVETLLVSLPKQAVPTAIELLAEHGVQIFEVTRERHSLEDLFLSLTEASSAEGDA